MYHFHRKKSKHTCYRLFPKLFLVSGKIIAHSFILNVALLLSIYLEEEQKRFVGDYIPMVVRVMKDEYIRYMLYNNNSSNSLHFAKSFHTHTHILTHILFVLCATGSDIPTESETK